MKLLLDIALTHLRMRKRQTLISVLGVATGVGFSIAMAALMQGSEIDFIQKIIDSTPHIIVKDEYRTPPLQPARRVFADGAVSLQGLRPKEELRGIKRGKDIANRLSRLDGVVVSPALNGQIVMRFSGKDVSATVLGMEPKAERVISRLDEDIVEGQIDALHTTANGVIVGTGLLRKLGAELGSTLSTSSPAGVFLKMKVVAVFHSGVVAKDDAYVYALLKKVQVLQKRSNVVNEIRIRLDNVNDARRLADRVEAQYGYRTESWDEANSGILEVFKVRNAIMYTVVGAILVVAAFGIFNIVSTITYEKSRDIAILRSLGFRQRDIRVIFVTEGLALGVLGSIVGSLFGYALCRLLGSIEFEFRMATDVTELPLHYSPIHYLIAAAFALGATGVAGYLPARKAARVDPVEIIRGAA